MPYGVTELGQHWFRQWLIARRYQAINFTNADYSSGDHLTKKRASFQRELAFGNQASFVQEDLINQGMHYMFSGSEKVSNFAKRQN